jgi:hypothetical protein
MKGDGNLLGRDDDSNRLNPRTLSTPRASRDALLPLVLRGALVALAVLAIGVLLGIGWFRLDQRTEAWAPAVERLDGGWQVTDPGVQVSGLSVYASTLSWRSDDRLLAMDLGTGKAVMLDEAREGESISGPVVSQRYVFWTKKVGGEDAGGSGDCTLYASGPAGQRTVVVAHDADADYSSISASGGTVAWLCDRPASAPGKRHQLHVAVIGAKKRWTIAPGGEVTDLSTSSQHLAWVTRSSQSGGKARIIVLDLRLNQRRVIPIGHHVWIGRIAASNDLLVWAESSSHNRRIVSNALSDGSSRVVPRADGSYAGLRLSVDGSRILCSNLLDGDTLRVTSYSPPYSTPIPLLDEAAHGAADAAVIGGGTAAWLTGDGKTIVVSKLRHQ